MIEISLFINNINKFQVSRIIIYSSFYLFAITSQSNIIFKFPLISEITINAQ